MDADLPSILAISANGDYESAINSLETVLISGIQGKIRANFAFELAEIYAKHVRNMQKAEEFMKESWEIERKIAAFSVFSAISGLELARIRLEMSEFLPAKATLEQVLIDFNEVNSPTYLFSQAYLAFVGNKLGEIETSRPLFFQVLEKCENLHPVSREFGLILKLSVSLLLENQDFIEAERNIERMISVSKLQKEHPEDLAIAYSIQGTYLMARKRGKLACEAYEKAMKGHVEHYPYSGRTVMACVEAAKCYRGEKHEKRGREIVELSIERVRMGRQNWVLAYALRKKGEFWMEKGDVQEALTCYTEAVDIYERSASLDPGHTECLVNIADILTNSDDSAQSENLYLQALQLAKITQNTTFRVEILLKLGDLYRNYMEDNQEMAPKYYQKAVKVANKIDSKSLLAAKACIHLACSIADPSLKIPLFHNAVCILDDCISIPLLKLQLYLSISKQSEDESESSQLLDTVNIKILQLLLLGNYPKSVIMQVFDTMEWSDEKIDSENRENFFNQLVAERKRKKSSLMMIVEALELLALHYEYENEELTQIYLKEALDLREAGYPRDTDTAEALLSYYNRVLQNKSDYAAQENTLFQAFSIAYKADPRGKLTGLVRIEISKLMIEMGNYEAAEEHAVKGLAIYQICSPEEVSQAYQATLRALFASVTGD